MQKGRQKISVESKSTKNKSRKIIVNNNFRRKKKSTEKNRKKKCRKKFREIVKKIWK